MNNKYVTDRIDEFTKLNEEYTRKFNAILNSIRREIDKEVAVRELTEKESHTQAYNQGVMDLWEAVYAICAERKNGGLHTAECMRMFDGSWYMPDIVEKLTCFEVLDRYKKYKEVKEEKEQREEAKKFKRGDIVMYDIAGTTTLKAIFLEETDTAYWTIGKLDKCPQQLPKCQFSLRKTGEHIDMSLD